jgi:hypothetical protein
VASTSLTGIFAPGSASLVESLRTLSVDPSRVAMPGETIRVQFSFSNLGGAPATGVRVRFAHPQGVEHVRSGDLVDDAPLPEGESFIDPNGAEIGTIEPNAARRVSCNFRVNEIIEDGSELVFQAALVTAETPIVGSNIERLAVRSRPDLHNKDTVVSLNAPPSPKPGEMIVVRAVVYNAGPSSARDVMITLPTPEHTSYIPGSARIDGRVVAGLEGEAFDYDSGTIISRRLAAAQSVIVEYQATIDSPLPDGTHVRSGAAVWSRECAEFTVESRDVVVASPVDFDGPETGLTLLCDDVVTPGMRVPMVLRAQNNGTGIAERVEMSFAMPRGLVYAPGSAHVDGQPVSDESISGLLFQLGALGAGRTTEVGIAATVAVPAPGETMLPVDAALRWRPGAGSSGERQFSRALSVRVAPRFSRTRNFISADRGAASAREDVGFTVRVYNDGTGSEDDVRLRLVPGLYFVDVRIAEEGGRESLAYDEPLSLGIVEPHRERVFTVSGRIASRVPDRSTVSLGAVLEHRGGAVDLGTAVVVVRSRPAVESVAWELGSRQPLRPNGFVDLIVRITNIGSDVLREGRLTLALPPELVLERAIDARRDRDGLAFADVDAETTHEARITLRLLRAVRANRALAIDGWLYGRGISPVQLDELEVPTYAQAQFAQSAQFLAIPSESVNAGERLYYEIRLRNDGDGPAERLSIRVVPTNLAVYVPASTTINGMTVGDDAGASQLWSPHGLVLADFNPGVEVLVRWEMMVFSPLAAGTALDSRAVLEWGEGTTFAIAAPTVRVQMRPTLSESTAGTPISVARLFPLEPVQHATPLSEPALELSEPPTPPAPRVPRREKVPRQLAEVIARKAESLAAAAAVPPPQPAPPPESGAAVLTPALYADFTPDVLGQRIRILERSAAAGGLIQHFLAMRMLFPENVLNGSPDLSATFATANRALRAPLEKLFVRLRMPRLSITAKDLEDRESRNALGTLTDALSSAPSAQLQPPAEGFIRVAGAIDKSKIRALAADLEKAPLGSVTPWLINAHLLGSTIYHDGDRSEALEQYRTQVLNVLSVLSDLPLDEFHRVLTSSVNRTLDEALAQVLGALRGAAHIGVD